MRRLMITQWCHERIRQLMPAPRRCLDATAGTGRDTLFLCKLAGKDRDIIAMDIQEEALEQTGERLLKEGCREGVRLIHDGHEHMDKYAGPGTLDLVMFNIGYLPGGDHNKATKPETTCEALTKSLTLLREGGLLSVLIYSGGDSGFEEKDAVLAWAAGLESAKYLAISEAFCNKPNHPPMPLFVLKLENNDIPGRYL